MKAIIHRDQIYGDVRYDPLAAALLDTQTLQRLGRIYQPRRRPPRAERARSGALKLRIGPPRFRRAGELSVKTESLRENHFWSNMLFAR